MFGGFKVDLAFTAFSHEDGSKYQPLGTYKASGIARVYAY